MGFIPELNKAVILVPKTGTKTIQHVAGNYNFEWGDDHRPYTELRKRIEDKYPDLAPTTEYAVNIRHPVERFLSGVFFCYKNPDPRFSVDFIYNQQVKEKTYDFIFRPQHKWLEGCDNIKLFKFDTMDICRWLGWTDDIPKLNSKERRFTREEMQAHPLYPVLMSRYDDDWKLWNCVL